MLLSKRGGPVSGLRSTLPLYYNGACLIKSESGRLFRQNRLTTCPGTSGGRMPGPAFRHEDRRSTGIHAIPLRTGQTRSTLDDLVCGHSSDVCRGFVLNPLLPCSRSPWLHGIGMAAQPLLAHMPFQTLECAVVRCKPVKQGLRDRLDQRSCANAEKKLPFAQKL